MKRSLIKVLFLVVFTLIIFPTAVFADNYGIDPSWKWSNPSNVTWKLTNYTGDSNWLTWVRSGNSAWHNAGTIIRMYETTLSPKVQYSAANFGNTGWDGATSKNLLTEVATVSLNNSYTSARNNAPELTAHEAGHTHGLLDVSATFVLMLDSGYKGSASPTIHDKEGISALYP